MSYPPVVKCTAEDAVATAYACIVEAKVGIRAILANLLGHGYLLVAILALRENLIRLWMQKRTEVLNLAEDKLRIVIRE